MFYGLVKARSKIVRLAGHLGHDGLEWNNTVCDRGFCPKW